MEPVIRMVDNMNSPVCLLTDCRIVDTLRLSRAQRVLGGGMLRRVSCARLVLSAMLLTAVVFCAACSAGADEFRGWWIDAWHNGFLSQTQVNKLLGVAGDASSTGDIRDANLNAVFVQVRRRADTCYPSGMGEPYFSSGLSPSTFNALQAIINAAHDTTGGKKRIEVHCWMVTFATDGGTVYSRHNNPSDPDNYWLTLDDSGAETDDKAFDPGHPKCEDYTVNVIMDLVSRFDIDGVHLDYIRYTGNDQGYNPTSVARYNARYGLSGSPVYSNSQWKQWRRDQVTAVVRKAYAKIQAVKPAVKLSGAFFTSTPSPTASTRSAFQSTPAYTDVYSDWDSWLQEGIIDMAVPMTYFDQSTHASDWTKWINFEKDRKANRHIVVGPGLYLNTLSDAMSQLLATRTASPAGNYANGFSGYDYYTPYDSGSWSSSWVSSLKSQVTTSAVDIPAMTWKTSPTKGHISGTVTQASTGTWVDGASVSVSGPTTRSMTTDGTGFYAFIDLPPGTYTVTAGKTGVGGAQKSVIVAVGSVTGNMYVTDFALGASAAPVIGNVQAGSLTSSGATITWDTDQTASSQVEYGTTASYGSSTTLDSTAVMSHAVALTGLSANTTYHYRVRSGNSNGTTTSVDYTFTTSGPPSISSVQATGVTSSAATITWATDTPSDSKVNYGQSTSYGSQASNATSTTSHSVTLSGLSANTTYHYQCVSHNAYGTATSGDYSFTTAPQTTEIVVDNADSGWSNTSPNGNAWTTGGTSGIPMVGSGYIYAYGEASTTETTSTRRCRWTPNLPAAGYYDVYVFFQKGANRTNAAPYVINYRGGQASSVQNQYGTASASAYVLAGQNLPFAAGTDGYVELSTIGAGSGLIVDADAVKWVYRSALDLTPPSISISGPSVTLTRGGPVSYAISYGEADSVNLNAANVSLVTTGTASGVVSVSGSGTASRTVTISSISGSGTIGIAVAAGTASDSAGNLALAAGPSAAFTVDNTAPSIAIGSPSVAATRGGPVTYTISYGGADAVSLTSAGITLNKTGTANGTVSVSGSGTTSRTVTVSSITGDGSLSISVAAGTATDNAGNAAPSAGPSATFSVDNTAPAISIGGRSASLTRGGPVTYMVAYTGADAITLTNSNVTLNKTGTATGIVSVTGSGNDTRTVSISSITGDGTIGISIAAGTASDAAGNTAAAAGPSSTFTVDNTAPTVSIGSPSAAQTMSGPITYTISYTGADSVNLANASVTLNKTGTANGTVAVSGAGTTSRTVTISSITGSGTLGISIAAGTASDSAGNSALAAGPSATLCVDNTPPSMASVTDDIYTTSTTSLQGSWSATSTRPIARYEYAVGTTSGGTNVKNWTSAGTATSATITGLSLSVGGTYYVSARAVDDAGLTSQPMSSAGVRIARPVAGIYEAKSLANGQVVALPPLTISARFAGYFYLQDIDRRLGIRVQSDASVTEGQSVSVFGTMGLSEANERAILSPKVVLQ